MTYFIPSSCCCWLASRIASYMYIHTYIHTHTHTSITKHRSAAQSSLAYLPVDNEESWNPSDPSVEFQELRTPKASIRSLSVYNPFWWLARTALGCNEWPSRRSIYQSPLLRSHGWSGVPNSDGFQLIRSPALAPVYVSYPDRLCVRALSTELVRKDTWPKMLMCHNRGNQGL